MMRTWTLAFVLAISTTLSAAPRFASAGDDAKPASTAPESWSGTVQIGDNKLDFRLELTRGTTPRATMAIPAQNMPATELKKLKVDGRSASFTLLAAGMPDAAAADFEVTFAEDGRSGSGVMKQGGLSLPVSLKRDGVAGAPPDPAPAKRRAQDPIPPFPYASREVSYLGKDEASLAGTLTVPDPGAFGAGPFPAVLLITGSGPQDRDETLMGHRPFLVLSDALTRRGVAVLRVDDRGVGKSTSPKPGQETTDDFAGDVLAGVAFLRSQKEVDGAKVGLIGHSEGALIAPMVAAQQPGVAFIVMLAGPGVPGRDVLVEQMIALLRSGGADEAAVKRVSTAQQRVLEVSGGEKPPSDQDLETALRALIGIQLEQSGRTVEEGAMRIALDNAKKQMTSPWMRRFLTLDPRDALRKVKCPVLVLNGELDTQVVARQNVPEISRALLDGGARDVTIHVLPGLNHLFQTCKTGSVTEYSQIEETTSPKVLRIIGDWILNRTGAEAPAPK